MQWKVKITDEFEKSIKGLRPFILKKIDKTISLLKQNPYVGKQLRPPYKHLWEIKINRRFRLYYEIYERQQLILLRAFYPRGLQKRYLRKRIKF